jgi:hypothetical protein
MKTSTFLWYCRLLCVAGVAAAAEPQSNPGPTGSAASATKPTEPLTAKPRRSLPPSYPDGWGMRLAQDPDPKLPMVLLIGDSIANGYYRFVVAKLRGKANVDLWINPYNQTNPKLLSEAKEALDTDVPYAVVHFNVGLHGYPKGRIPEGRYDPLTRQYVQVLRENSKGAELIWASITPVTVVKNRLLLDTENNPVMVEHNALAAAIMKDEQIPIDDLYGLMVQRLDLGAGDGCHWTAEGYKLMADQVAKLIIAELKGAGS